MPVAQNGQVRTEKMETGTMNCQNILPNPQQLPMARNKGKTGRLGAVRNVITLVIE
jgi:hypothetical protein